MDFLQMQKTISLVDIPNSAQLLTAISVISLKWRKYISSYIFAVLSIPFVYIFVCICVGVYVPTHQYVYIRIW